MVASAEAIEAHLLQAEAEISEINEAIRQAELQLATNRERIAAQESTIEHERDGVATWSKKSPASPAVAGADRPRGRSRTGIERNDAGRPGGRGASRPGRQAASRRRAGVGGDDFAVRASSR